jgi:hypothetical protein
MHLVQGGSGRAAPSRLKCPGDRETFYEGFDASVAVCSNCFEKRKAHKLPSIKGPCSPHSKQDHSKSASTATADPMQAATNSHMMCALRRSSPPPVPTAALMKRPLPHWRSWFECLDDEGKPIGMYTSPTRSQSERPELPMPQGWVAQVDSQYSATYYVDTRTETSQWNVPLPLCWKEQMNPTLYVREWPGVPAVAQSRRPSTFAFCPSGHPLRSYCDR